jgi:hypothetical protein
LTDRSPHSRIANQLEEGNQSNIGIADLKKQNFVQIAKVPDKIDQWR